MKETSDYEKEIAELNAKINELTEINIDFAKQIGRLKSNILAINEINKAQAKLIKKLTKFNHTNFNGV